MERGRAGLVDVDRFYHIVVEYGLSLDPPRR
jgi:hypothetical protein